MGQNSTRRAPGQILVLSEAHLRRVMLECVEYFNGIRPHQGLEQQIPVMPTTQADNGPVRSRNVPGDIIHDCYREAAQLPTPPG